MEDRYVYKLYCKDDSSRFYIGSTSNIITRLKQHQYYAHQGKKTMLYFDMRNRGIINWKIKTLLRVEDCTCQTIQEIEQYYIRKLNPPLNKAIRRIKLIGRKQYIREWHQKNRDACLFRCEYCNINCSSSRQLYLHKETSKHKTREARALLDYYERL
jgi:hypothetical protein